MKKLITLFLFAFYLNANAQITLENIYPNSQYKLGLAKFSRSGFKYFVVDQTASTIKLYNLSHTLYRTITVPIQTITPWSLYYLSESLFDTDSSDFDYIISEGFPIKTTIYNENGTVIFTVDSFGITGSYPGMAGAIQPGIVNTDSGAKMIMANPSSGTRIYGLPGMLVCGSCGNPYGGPLNVGDNLNLKSPFLSNPYPNPAINYTTIDYTLPQGEKQGEIVFYDLSGREIKRMKVDNTFSNVKISTSDIAAGTYLFDLQTSKQQSAGKKIVVIK